MFTLTPNAAEQILKAAEQGNSAGLPLRLAAEKKKDGAFDYRMGFDEAQEKDIRTDSEGVKVIFDPSYKSLLKGTTMDYVELEPNHFHFIFLNPNDPNYSPPIKEVNTKQ